MPTKSKAQELAANLEKRTIALSESLFSDETEQNAMLVIDTGGFIKLFPNGDNEYCSGNKKVNYVTTAEVLSEIENQGNWKVMNKIYEMIAYDKLSILSPQIIKENIKDRDKQLLQYAMKKGGYNGKRRIQAADRSLFYLAHHISTEDNPVSWESNYPIVVSCDSDLSAAIVGTRTERIGYLQPRTFKKMIDKYCTK